MASYSKQVAVVAESSMTIIIVPLNLTFVFVLKLLYRKVEIYFHEKEK